MEMYRKDIQGLLSFLADSPTAFHTVDNFARMLREHGFQLLSESVSAPLFSPERPLFSAGS